MASLIQKFRHHAREVSAFVGVCVIPCSMWIGCSLDGGTYIAPPDPRTTAIEGRILGPSDVPASGCEVALLEENRGFANSPEPQPVFLPRDRAATGGDGRFRFGNLPAGRYALVARNGSQGAYGSILLSEAAGGVELHLKEYGSFAGILPKEISDSRPTLYAWIDELDRAIAIGPDGSFGFDSLPEGNYHLRLNLTQRSIDFSKSPLDIEVSSGHAAALSDTVFQPWSARFKIGNVSNRIASESGAFGMLCADSIAARARCFEFEQEELLGGMPFRCFPIGSQVRVDLTIYDSSGSEIASGGARWLDPNDSLLEIAVQ